jgi:hypothetical protein
MNHNQPVRYPNGYYGRRDCLFAYWKNAKTLEWEKLDYIAARAKIYAPVYAELAKKEAEYQTLKQMRESGTNLLLLDVDGPRYDQTAPPFDVVDQGSLEIDDYTLKELINNPSQPFCHCYVLAGCLLGLEHIWQDMQ